MIVGLGDGAGILSALLGVSAIFKSALRVLSPASNVGVVENGGSVKIVTIYVVAYCKKMYILTFGNGTILGKM